MKTSYPRLIIILSLIIKTHSQYTATDLCISGSHNSDHHGTWNYYGIKNSVHQGKAGLMWRQSSTGRYLYPKEHWGVRWGMIRLSFS